MIGWKSRRPRKRRAKNRRRRAKESTRKSMRAARVQATPAAAAAVIAVIQTVVASLRARRARKRKKSPVGITALRANDESRVRKRPPLTGAGHRVLATDRSGLKRRLEITHKEGQRGEGAGVHVAAPRRRSSWREGKRERGTTAGTGRSLAAPTPAWTEVGAAREAGRTEVKSDDTVEIRRGTEEAQKEGKEEQLMGGAEAERGEKKGREGEEAGARVGRE